MNGNFLQAKIIEEGLNTTSFVELLNKEGTKMDRATFYKKKNGTSDFTRKEILGIRKVLSLSDQEVMRIFFTTYVS